MSGPSLLAVLALAAASPAQLDLSRQSDEAALAEILWQNSAELRAARGRQLVAESELDRSRLLPNPAFDFSWNTVPVGATNPPGLNPLADVPNYQVWLAWLIDVSKRGPRQASAAAGARGAAIEALERFRQAWLSLLEQVGEVASAELRIAVLSELAADAERVSELQRQRTIHGETAHLDAERAELESESFSSALAAEQQQLREALRLCGERAGIPCHPFGTQAAAASFLARRSGRPPPAGSLESRADLQTLAAERRAAEADLELARRQLIPDPTVRLGFTHDRFTISGNQRNSIGIGVAVPLPLFDRGQTAARAARARIAAAQEARDLLLTQAQSSLESLARQRAELDVRRARLSERSIPLARALVTRLEAAVRTGGAGLQELLLARRTLGELALRGTELEQTAFLLAVAAARVGGELPPGPVHPQ